MDIFEQELREGLKGSLYKSAGFKFNPFTPIPPLLEETFVNRATEQKDIARDLVDMINRRVDHLAILGISGIGKTHFLMYVAKKLHNMLNELGFHKLFLIQDEYEFKTKMRDFDAEAENQRPMLTGYDYLIRLEPDLHPLILIDNADVIMRTQGQKLCTILEKFRSCVISVWSHRGWKLMKKSLTLKVPKSSVVILDPFGIDDCVEILKRRILVASSGKRGVSFFSEDALCEIAVSTGGNPYNLIDLADKCLHFALDEGLKSLDAERIKSVLVDMGVILPELSNLLKSLTPAQRTVFNTLMDMKPSTASELGLELNLTRTAVVQHLQKLKQKKLVKNIQKLRRVLYYVPEEIVRHALTQEEFRGAWFEERSLRGEF